MQLFVLFSSIENDDAKSGPNVKKFESQMYTYNSQTQLNAIISYDDIILRPSVTWFSPFQSGSCTQIRAQDKSTFDTKTRQLYQHDNVEC